MTGEFPSGQSGPLISGPSFIDPDMHRDAGIVSRVDRSSCGTIVDKSQPTCIAVCEYIYRLCCRLPCGNFLNESKAILPYILTSLDIFFGNVLSSLECNLNSIIV